MLSHIFYQLVVKWPAPEITEILIQARTGRHAKSHKRKCGIESKKGPKQIKQISLDHKFCMQAYGVKYQSLNQKVRLKVPHYNY